MNATETLQILRMVKAICPSQAIDDYTPDAWTAILDDTRYADAHAAVIAIAKRPLEIGRARYIEPGHIRSEVRRIRAERIKSHPPVEPPPEATENVAAYLDWYRDTQHRIADGETITDNRQLVHRHIDYNPITRRPETAPDAEHAPHAPGDHPDPERPAERHTAPEAVA